MTKTDYPDRGPLRVETFVRESNRIEGITREPSNDEINAHEQLMRMTRVSIEHVQRFVSVCQPGAVLRDRATIHGVRVGSHVAPPSGPAIATDLMLLLNSIAEGEVNPWAAHVKYETLHPFTDGNGRSGRAIWLWGMTLAGQQKMALDLGFLHTFYYQTLAVVDRNMRATP